MPLPPRVPEIRALDLLLTVAELGSLGRAAHAHGISQQAAASRIRHLEDQLGLSLIERSALGSRLTPHGATVADWARDVVAAAAALDAGVEALRLGESARLPIAASMTVAEYLVPNWLVDLRARRPGTTVALYVVNSAEVGRLVGDGEVELGFVEAPVVPADLDSIVIGHDRLALVVAPGHRWARSGRVTREQLAAEPLVQREPGSGTRETVEAVLGDEQPLVAAAVELSSTAAIKAAVRAGVGPAVLSRLAVSEDLRRGVLVEVAVADVDLRRELRAVWAKGRRLGAATRDVLTVATQGGVGTRLRPVLPTVVGPRP